MTTFKDRWETDESGKRFIFTIEMQRRLAEAGLPVEPAALARLGTAVSRPAPARSQEPASAATDDNEDGSGNDVAAPATIQIDPQTGKYIGRVKWYNARKGYGFLVRGAGEEIFFHKSSTVGEAEELAEGQWILYDVEETRKGPEATEVEAYTGDVSLIEME